MCGTLKNAILIKESPIINVQEEKGKIWELATIIIVLITVFVEEGKGSKLSCLSLCRFQSCVGIKRAS